ncbi:uncharacterized protein LOC110235725 [Exaiptasia diaphana]|uniref:Uncharacterized protein n=1 Tax=Exaiptasia diaphana TaxID=2652724 RepID=A0A913X075_EXADI|nr:uncharacterized protein LOC110235725 [Exaiptasia diaphana]
MMLDSKLLVIFFLLIQSNPAISTEDEGYQSSLILTTDDYMLLGQTIDKKKATDVFDCALCLVGDRCKSFNFNVATGDCHLNGKRAKRNELVPMYGFIYGEKNPCEAKPCQNGGECSLQNDRQDYKCKCRNGFSGKRCQKGRRSLTIVKYVITVYTGNKWGTGTDATVWIAVTGKQMSQTLTTTEFNLPGKFEKRDVEPFNLQFANMNPITELKVRTRKNGPLDDWYLNKISVDNTHQKVRTTFTCNCWIKPTDSKTMSSPTIENY